MKEFLTKEELYEIVKRAVREVIREEKINIFLESVPYVSDEEMRDIENTYGTPSKEKESAYSEFIEI